MTPPQLLHFALQSANSQDGPATSPRLPQEALRRDAGSRPLAQTAHQSLSEPFDNNSHLGICYSSSDAEKNQKRQELAVP